MGEVIADALASVVRDKYLPGDELVSKAFEYLKEVFQKHFHESMLEAGRYLIKKFYDNDYELARKGKKAEGKSLLQLINKIKANSDNAPSQAWVYDAVKIAVDEHDYVNFYTYRNLRHSQKLLLTHVKDKVKKQALIQEAADEQYTVKNLRKRIKEEKEDDDNKLPGFDKVPSITRLRKL
jgi:hypothetical protein